MLERLAAARSPVMVVDAEIRSYGVEAEVADLAERLSIPVVTTFMGRGLRVHTRRELAEALERAVADQGRFVLIDVVMARGQVSSTLSRFVEGFQRRRGAADSG